MLELPGYAPPWWLDAPVAPGRMSPMAVAGETADDVPVTVWTPERLADDEPAPLLLVHDGPEYDLLAGMTRYSGALVEAGVLPPHRVALAHPSCATPGTPARPATSAPSPRPGWTGSRRHTPSRRRSSSSGPASAG